MENYLIDSVIFLVGWARFLCPRGKTSQQRGHKNVPTLRLLVGANLFAHNLLFVRINSYLHTPQLHFLG
jgi:hypothetical protein